MNKKFLGILSVVIAMLLLVSSIPLQAISVVDDTMQNDGFTTQIMIDGGCQTLMLKGDGSVWAVGTLPNEEVQSVPYQLPGLSNITMVSSGLYHSAMLKDDGTVWTMGNNEFGQLGTGDTQPSNVAVQVEGLTDVVAVSAGRYYTLALKSDGTVWGWGLNLYGQLGDGTRLSRYTPVKAVNVRGATQICAGLHSSFALMDDGTIWVWGVWEILLPVMLTTVEDVVQVTEFYALKSDGTVWILFSSDGLAQVKGLSNIVKIESNNVHGIALKDDGTVWTWGANVYGQLGDGTYTNSAKAVQVTGLTDVIDISMGTGYSLAIKSDGTVWGWGDNETGRLGTGESDIQSPVPVQMVGEDNIGMFNFFGSQYKVGSAEGLAGDQVEVEVSIVGNTGISSLSGFLSYDSDALFLVDAKDTGLLKGYHGTPEIAGVPLPLSWEDSDKEDNASDGTILTLTFLIKEDAAPGDYDITFEYLEALKSDQTEVPFTDGVGVVTVKPIIPTYTIEVTAGDGGNVSGGGEYLEGDTVQLEAAPDSDYEFAGWYEDGELIEGAGEVYSFTATSDRILSAEFIEKQIPSSSPSSDQNSSIPSNIPSSTPSDNPSSEGSSDSSNEQTAQKTIVMRLNAVKALLDGAEIAVDPTNETVSPFTLNGKTMVPVRFVENLDAEVKYNGATKPVTVTYGDIQLTLEFGKDTMTRVVGDGEPETITLPTAPSLVEGKTCVPIREVAEGIGFSVKYESHVIVVSTDQLTEDEQAEFIELGKKNLPAFIEGVKSISTSKTEFSLKVGKNVQIEKSDIIFTPTKVGCDSLVYSSDNEAVATVTSKGKINAISKGTAKITIFSHNGKKIVVNVTVS